MENKDKTSDKAHSEPLQQTDVVRSFTESDLKAFIIKLRLKHRKIEETQIFCQEHNFKLEAQAKQNEADVLRRVIHEMENEFDLGFVWDKSLD